MKCQKCGNHSDRTEAKFCSQCGSLYSQEKEEIKYIGISKDRGIYKITFASVEGMFDDKEQAQDAARHSCWNNDELFKGYSIKLVKKVAEKSHPFICGDCGDYVAENTEGLCNGCGNNNWIRRHQQKK